MAISRIISLIVTLCVTVALSGPAVAQSTLRLGVTSGPYADVDRFAAKLAAKHGLKVEVIEFADYQMPNSALAAGDIDFSNMQSRKYLRAQSEARGYDFVVIAPTIIVPLGFYSKKHARIEDIPAGSLIGIPNDPANLARSLAFLEKRGLLELPASARDNATVVDIKSNPRRFRFVELDHGLLARSLDDTAASIVTLNYALNGGLDPTKALTTEDYANDFNTVNFVTKRGQETRPDILKFVGIYRSDDVKTFIRERFKGHVPAAW